MSYLGNTPSETFHQATSQVFNGDGSTTAFTLEKRVNRAEEIEVFVNNIQQQPTVAYSANNNTLTFTEAPDSATGNIYVVYRMFAQQNTFNALHDFTDAVTMASTLAVTGAVTANAGVKVDNITIDGTEIDLSSGNLTIDVAGQLVINSDSGQVVLQDDAVNWGNLQNSSGDFVIGSLGADKDIIFQGLDGSSTIEAMRIDVSAGGKVGIGTSSPTAKLDVTGAIEVDDKITIAYEAGSSDWELESTSGDDFSVSRNGSEAFLLDGSTTYPHFRGSSQVRITMGSAGTAGTNTANWIRGSSNQVDLNTAGDGYGFEVLGNQKVAFANNGNVTNSTGSYGTISDEKLKENISDASSQWGDVKALKVRKYSMKEDNLGSANKIGVIAQELETSGMNGLVEEIKWNKETVKTVKYSILYMKAIKALQEAMTRIETLEIEVKALKGA